MGLFWGMKEAKASRTNPMVQRDIILTHNCSLVRNRKMVNLYPALSGTLETSAWDLVSHADFLRGSSRVPAPRSLGRIAWRTKGLRGRLLGIGISQWKPSYRRFLTEQSGLKNFTGDLQKWSIFSFCKVPYRRMLRIKISQWMNSVENARFREDSRRDRQNWRPLLGTFGIGMS